MQARINGRDAIGAEKPPSNYPKAAQVQSEFRWASALLHGSCRNGRWRRPGSGDWRLRSSQARLRLLVGLAKVIVIPEICVKRAREFSSARAECGPAAFEEEDRHQAALRRLRISSEPTAPAMPSSRSGAYRARSSVRLTLGWKDATSSGVVGCCR